ncbi:metallophosphoesterase [Geomobilimonas luticola]|uniref:Metallophosphoesterase n=1 Tax=Geomobilimonas luticola TaxID=1114878 RepID=A0ABS5SH08_9BACT|nr:metallophosphoesterase [Geomobilimonas luticola]MBT0654641.1 metallophosphoesterase [Geomobilimonas luticola]
MNLFLVTFFLVYGGVHLYTFFKARQAIGFGPLAGTLLALFLAAMVIAPLLVRSTERHGYETAARLTAYVGYGWMGFLFLFFSAAMAVDCYRLVLFLAVKVWHFEPGRLVLSPRAAFYLPLVWGVATSLYGYFEARDIRADRVVLRSPRIPREVGKFVVVQMSDVHLGLIVREERLARMLALVREANPDLLVVTGDLVDGQINGLAGLAEQFRQITPPYGKYAVTGNHEFYAGIDQALAFENRAGFTLLRGDIKPVTAWLTLAGVDDPAYSRVEGKGATAETHLLASLPRDRFTILLKHRPTAEQTSMDRFDLQLSGHVHKGQIFPFNLVTYLFYPVKAGLTRLGNDSSLYVSRGTGTWGPPLRFLAPPEVTVIELHPASGE